MRYDPELTLWQRARQGDEGAYGQLLRNHAGQVGSEIRRRLRYAVADDLQDLQQVVWTAVWTALPHFRGESAFGTWVIGITKHVVCNWLRHQRVRALALNHVSASVATLRGNGQNGRDHAVINRLALLEAMQVLLASEREAINLRYFGELSDAEIARRLGLPLGTVKSRIRHGLGKLRSVLRTP